MFFWGGAGSGFLVRIWTFFEIFIYNLIFLKSLGEFFIEEKFSKQTIHRKHLNYVSEPLLKTATPRRRDLGGIHLEFDSYWDMTYDRFVEIQEFFACQIYILSTSDLSFG